MRYIFGLLVCIMAFQSMYSQDWRQLNSGVDTWLTDVVFLSEDTGWVIGTEGTLIHTTNGGELWEAAPYQLRSGASDAHFTSICFISSDIGIIAGSYQDTDTEEERTLLLRTSDQGKTWLQSPDDITGWINDLSFSTPEHGYACGIILRPPGMNDGAFLARTTDRGITWSYDFGITHFFSRMRFRDSGIGFGFYSTEPYSWVSKTTDDGKSWGDFSYGPDVQGSVYGHYDLEYLGSATWLFITSLGIMRSTDDGESWIKVDSSRLVRECSLFDNRVGYGVDRDSENPHLISKTTDSGITWIVHDTKIPGIRSLEAIAVPSDNIAYAVGANGMILKTTNGGGPLLSVPDQSQLSRTGLSIVTYPVTGRAHCSFAATTTPRTLLICDLLGRTIHTQVIESGTNTLEFDTSTLPPGLYLCRLGNKTARFVVVR
jgi:photosystem II stability/assembly factor-like uncharacterized protein